MARQGHNPTVITAAADLPAKWKLEQEADVRVLRIRTSPTKDVSHFRRTINEMRLPYALLAGLHDSGLGTTGWSGVVSYAPTIFLGPVVAAIRGDSGCKSYL